MKRPETRPSLTIIMRKPLQDYIRFAMSLDAGYKLEDDLLATKNSYLGRLVEPFLEYCPGNEIPLLPGKGPDHFTFGLPQFRSIETRCNTVWISRKNQLNIQNLAYHHFRLHFQMFVDDKVRYRREVHTAKGGIKSAIQEFCSAVNIKFDEVTYEMLSKAYYRSRIKREKNGFSPCKPVMIGRLFFLV
jgi:hypothetical protein